MFPIKDDAERVEKLKVMVQEDANRTGLSYYLLDKMKGYTGTTYCIPYAVETTYANEWERTHHIKVVNPEQQGGNSV